MTLFLFLAFILVGCAFAELESLQPRTAELRRVMKPPLPPLPPSRAEETALLIRLLTENAARMR